MGPDALKLPQELGQRGTLIAPTQERGEWMLMGIKRGEVVDTQKGGKKQGLQPATKSLLAVLSKGKVVTGVRLLIRSDGLLELRHHRVKGPLLIEPVGQKMHPDIRQTGLYLDALGSGGCRPRTGLVARAALGPIELPPTP